MTLSGEGMNVTLGVAGDPGLRLDFHWSDAIVTGCNAVLKWFEGSHIAGDPLRNSRGLLHVARLSLGILRDLVVEEKTDPGIAFTRFVTMAVEVSEGSPPIQIER